MLLLLGCLATKTHTLERDVGDPRAVWGDVLGSPRCTLATAFPGERGEGPLQTEVLLELEQTWQGQRRVPIETYREDEAVDPGWVITGLGGLGMAMVTAGTFGITAHDFGSEELPQQARWGGGGLMVLGAGTLAWTWHTNRRIGERSEPYEIVESSRLDLEISEVRPGAWIALELRDDHGVLASGESDQEGRALLAIERSASQDLGVFLAKGSEPICEVDLRGTPAVAELDSAEVIALVEQGRLEQARLALELSPYASGGWEAWCSAAGPGLLDWIVKGDPTAAALLLHGPEQHCKRWRSRASRAWNVQLERALKAQDPKAAEAWIASGPKLDPSSSTLARASRGALSNMEASLEELDPAAASEWLRLADLLLPLDVELQHEHEAAIRATVPLSWQPRLDEAALACRAWSVEVMRRRELIEAAEEQGAEAVQAEQEAFDDWLFEQETGELGEALAESRAIQEEMRDWEVETGEEMDLRLVEVAATMKAACP